MTELTLFQRVKINCGVRDPTKELPYSSDEEFENALQQFIMDTTEWISTYTKRTEFPGGLNQILVEIVSNIIRNQVIRQGVPIYGEDESENKNYVEREITSDIQLRLNTYIKRPVIRVKGY